MSETNQQNIKLQVLFNIRVLTICSDELQVDSDLNPFFSVRYHLSLSSVPGGNRTCELRLFKKKSTWDHLLVLQPLHLCSLRRMMSPADSSLPVVSGSHRLLGTTDRNTDLTPPPLLLLLLAGCLYRSDGVGYCSGDSSVIVFQCKCLWRDDSSVSPWRRLRVQCVTFRLKDLVTDIEGSSHRRQPCFLLHF